MKTCHSSSLFLLAKTPPPSAIGFEGTRTPCVDVSPLRDLLATFLAGFPSSSPEENVASPFQRFVIPLLGR